METAIQTPSAVTARPLALPTIWKLALAIGFSALLVAAAQVRIHLPTTPVPVTLQSMVAVLAGVTLGARFGSLAVGLYLMLGLTVPGVFANGLDAMFTHTGGYLNGLLLAQPVIAVVTHHDPEHSGDWLVRLFLAGLLGHVIIFACGVAGLLGLTGGNLVRAFELGVLPFLLGTILKMIGIMVIGLPLGVSIRPRIDGR